VSRVQMSFRTTPEKRDEIISLAQRSGKQLGDYLVERATSLEGLSRDARTYFQLYFVRHEVKSNGVKVEYARIFLEEGGKKDWIGEIEIEKNVFISRFHQGFSRDLLRAILEKWESEAKA
jgi:hypothetical protein